MTTFKKLIFAVAVVTASAGMRVASAADMCQERFIKMVVPNPAGGAGDVMSRLLAERASVHLGQSVVVENRSGATTAIGTDMVAKSKPDGCTILAFTASGVIVSVLREKLPYDLTRDFTPIIGVGSLPMVIAVPAAAKINSFADLKAAAKSKDGITYGTGGAGSMAHLSTVGLINEFQGTGNHIPYRGNSDALQGLLANHVQLFFPSVHEALPHAKTGKLRLLAVTSAARVPVLPDVPTTKELGIAEFKPTLWFAFLAPANTPASAVSRLHDALAKALAEPAIQQKLKASGFAPEAQGPSAVSALMKSEAARWGKVINENNIKYND